MKVSWNWLSEMVDLSKVSGPQALGELLTARGLEVEAIERQDAGLEKVITAQILERAKHPEADRLSLCKVTTGTGDPLEIVCGAQNMKAGDKVAFAQVGAHLPNGLKIAAGKIRGVVSNGMLCSEVELKLKEEGEGILILPPATQLGRPLAEVLGRDDTILTFKLTANRGDCLSHFGMAREMAAALGQTPKRPPANELKFASSGSEGAGPIRIYLEAGESAPQFYGCYIEGVKIGPSPEWVVRRLEALGSRSINNVVDATNLLMLELGQPVHAYDAERIQGSRIGVRMSQPAETLPLLDGSTITLQGTELVIVDGGRAVGLAGVMGGGNSEVQPATTRVFLECAEFAPGLVRKAASRHQKRTDAAHRFERGVDPRGLPHAISRLARLVMELAGGTVKGATFVQTPARAKFLPGKIAVDPAYFEKFLGLKVPLSSAKAEEILKHLDCQVDQSGTGWSVQPPSYRSDLTLKEDLAEEIARTIGYDQIASTVPPLSSQPAFGGSARVKLELIDRAKDALRAAGLEETVNFSFTSRSWLSKFNLTSSMVLVNPISEEHEALVPSLLPGLVKNTLDNWHHHFGSEALAIRLFELRPTFRSEGAVGAKGETETGTLEGWKLSMVLSGPRFANALRGEQGEVDFSDLRGIIESLLDQLGTKGVRFQPMTASRTGGHPLFHPGQSAEVLAGGGVAGHFGLLHPAQARDLKTRAPLWIAELDWDVLSKLSRPLTQSRAFKTWPEFPTIERDFALVVRNDVTADKITQVALKAGKPLAKIAKVFDVYRGSQVQEGMTSVAVRVIFYEESRSLQESEAEASSALILDSWKKELGAQLRGN